MHPLVLESAVRQRRAEIELLARRGPARARAVCGPPRPTVRQRVGWFLVERGLRLVAGAR